MKVISANEAVAKIGDGWRVIVGGFGCCGSPDTLTSAVRENFIKTGHPRELRLLFASGTGDKNGRGLDELALPGLVSEAIGGFWGFCPALTKMARSGSMEAHNWPQGTVCEIFSAIGAGKPAVTTKIGLHTFIDPRHEGGVISPNTETLIKVAGDGEAELLSFPALKPDCCLLRGTYADRRGNISMEDETSFMDALSQAIAVKNSGGIVIVQVRAAGDARLAPGDVKIPGMLVDYVVVSTCDHPQTYGRRHDAGFTSHAASRALPETGDMPLVKQIIVSRAYRELRKFPGRHINFGIGIPALIGRHARAQNFDDYWLTVESGVVGGIPEDGMSFGASIGPEAIIDQSSLFDFYHGGGIAAAFLGFGQIDRHGNVNVSRFGDRQPGAGGFINISQSARNIVFCGTFSTRGLRVRHAAGDLHIDKEGEIPKFVNDVEQITFSARFARETGQHVSYITERAVFRLGSRGLVLCEVAPGFSASDIQRLIPFPVETTQPVVPMRSSLEQGDLALQ